MGIKKLRKAANQLNVKFIEKSATSLKADGKSIDIATLAGVADVPPSSYHRGADVGIVNYKARGGDLESGAYTLRITANDEIRERGEHPAIAELINENGKTASRQRINLDVFSPEVPTNRTFDQAVFSLESRFREDMLGGFQPASIIVVFWCSNGAHGIIWL